MVAVAAVAMGAQALGGLFQLGKSLRNNKKQARYLTKQRAAVSKAAMDDSIHQFGLLNKMEAQNTEQAAQVLQNVLRQGAQARGDTQVSAGSSGVSGNSLQALEGDLARQTLSRIMAEQSNLQGTRDQLQEQGRQVAARNTNRISEVMAQRVPKVDVFGQLFKIGTDMFSSYLSTTSVGEGGKRTFDQF